MQTELYIPAPVKNGIVPKNNYGNVDVYTSSMIPPGGAHIVRPSISIAAQFAGIDYADAVTGFDFVRNRGTARVNGIVVAEENVEGLLAVWEGMMERVKEEEERRRVIGVLERWRRFIIGLGIRRRLDETHGKVDDTEMEMDVVEDGENFGGGFLLGAVQDGQGFVTNVRDEPQLDASVVPHSWQVDEGRSFVKETFNDTPKDGMKTVVTRHGRQPSAAEDNLEDTSIGGDAGKNADVESEGGGFVQDDDDSDGGGFIYDDEDGIL